jgi:hypothetical protein
VTDQSRKPLESRHGGIAGYVPAEQPVILAGIRTNGFLQAINGPFQAAKHKARIRALLHHPHGLFPIAGKLDISRLNPYVAQPN